MWSTDSMSDWRTRALMRAASRQIDNAGYSALTWRMETRQLIRDEARTFLAQMQVRSSAHLFDDGPTVQFDLHSGDYLPVSAGSPDRAHEEACSIVYAPSENGSILVTAWPHGSAVSEVKFPGEGANCFVLDFIKDSRELAGATGRARIRRHLRDFVRLSLNSRGRMLPSKHSGKFLNKLTQRSQEYRSTFASADEAHRHRLSHEANLGIGLVGGLIASSVFPFAKDFGTEHGQRAKETLQICADAVRKADAEAQQQVHSLCMRSRHFLLDKQIEATLGTGPLLMFALTLTLVSTFIVWRITRRR